MGFLRPTSGRAIVLGHDAWADAPAAHARVSFVSSDPGYLGGAPGAGTARVHGAPAWPARVIRGGSSRSVSIGPECPDPQALAGNRQKVAVVQAFMGREPLLVMDEPTSGLDPLMQREFLKLVAAAQAEGRTVFLSSHNLPEVERACDRVGIIRDGRLVSVSSVTDLQASHWRSVNLVLSAPVPVSTFDLPDVKVVSADARDVHLMVRGDVNPLLRRLATIDVRDISIVTLDVEDIFLGYYTGVDADAADPHGTPGRAA